MSNDMYRKLVDLYVGDELPHELKEELELAALKDPTISHDMTSLKHTVSLLKQHDDPEFTEESFQRILMKMYARGVEAQTQVPTESHWQYRLPLSG